MGRPHPLDRAIPCARSGAGSRAATRHTDRSWPPRSPVGAGASCRAGRRRPTCLTRRPATGTPLSPRRLAGRRCAGRGLQPASLRTGDGRDAACSCLASMDVTPVSRRPAAITFAQAGLCQKLVSQRRVRIRAAASDSGTVAVWISPIAGSAPAPRTSPGRSTRCGPPESAPERQRNDGWR